MSAFKKEAVHFHVQFTAPDPIKILKIKLTDTKRKYIVQINQPYFFFFLTKNCVKTFFSRNTEKKNVELERGTNDGI